MDLYSCLVIGGERQWAAQACQALDRCGIRGHYAVSEKTASNLFARCQLDAVVLNVAESSDTALDMIFRALKGRAGPLLVMSKNCDEEDHIRWLWLGATDVVPADLSLQIVAMKVRRIIDIGRGRRTSVSERLLVGPLEMNPAQARARLGELDLQLTSKEYELMYLLASRVGEFVHRVAIAQALRQGVNGRGIDMMVSKIRRKLRDVPHGGISIETVYGQGYRLSLDVNADSVAPNGSRRGKPEGAEQGTLRG